MGDGIGWHPSPILFLGNRAWEAEAEGKLCDLGTSNAISGPVEKGGMEPWKAMVSTWAFYPAPLWDPEEQRLGHHLRAALLAWAFSFLGRVQSTLAMAWLPGAVACAENTDNEAGHPVVGDEGDRQVHKHMPVAMLRCTWRPSQEDWRPKWTDSLKLLGLMGYLLYLQTTKAWGTQFTSMKTI